MTDNEIIKALECCMDEMGCKKGCPCFDPKSKSSHCTAIGDNGLEKLALDLINRQKAEIEGLSDLLKRHQRHTKSIRILTAETAKKIKAEAYKEFYEELHTEILAARDSNFKAKEERIAKSEKYGIPIDIEDNFLMYCDGKIHALDGIDYFAYETYKELVGDNDEKI